MRIIYKLMEMTETARGWLAGGKVGFVPTMGYLHAGHVRLIETARQECEVVVVSIFVNPLQFAQHRDFLAYPRDLARDIQLLREADVDVVFAPSLEEMYPANFATYISPAGSVVERLEGMFSPAYVRGLATNMMKLFQLVRPDITYFSQDDAQQVAMARQLIRDFNIDIDLSTLPSVRENNGLAISNRNHTLTSEEKQIAGLIYQALLAGKEYIDQGERRVSVIEQAMRRVIAAQSRLSLDYVVICHPDTLMEVAEVVPQTMLAIAAHIRAVRLTDNIVWLGNGDWLL